MVMQCRCFSAHTVPMYAADVFANKLYIFTAAVAVLTIAAKIIWCFF